MLNPVLIKAPTALYKKYGWLAEINQIIEENMPYSTWVNYILLCKALMMRICPVYDHPFLKSVWHSPSCWTMWFSILFWIALENILYVNGKSDKGSIVFV